MMRTNAARTAVKRKLLRGQTRWKSSVGSLSNQTLHLNTKRVAGTPSERIDFGDSRNYRRRQQHQLLVSSNSSAPPEFQNYEYRGFPSKDEKERFEAMRIFLDSLQLVTAQNTLTPTSSTTSLQSVASERDLSNNVAAPSERELENVKEECSPSKSDDLRMKGKGKSIHSREAARASSSSRANSEANEFDRLKMDLRHSINRKDVKKSMLLLRESQQMRQILPRAAVTNLFFMVSEFDPASAYNIIQYYNKHYLHQDSVQDNGGRALDGLTKKRLSLYKRISNSLGLLDPNLHNTKHMHDMVQSLLAEIDQMDLSTKRILYPKLVVSLVSQRIATIGPYANELYNFMIEHDFKLKAGWLIRLLSLSRYNRQDDLPFHDVIARLVKVPGGQLNADATLPAIQNLFPFTNTEAICVVLEAWIEDFENKHGPNVDDDSLLNPHHLIDLSMLETISIGAAQAGSSRLISLVWNILEICRYSPTESIYENTVIAFANEKGGLVQAFAALASMKEDGFEPSRPLIRSFSSALRFHRPLIGEARRLLMEDRENELASMENDQLFSLESLNVVLSSYAERADPQDAVEILEIMNECGLEPNADSYSFAIEALGRDIKKRLKMDDQSYKERNLQIADTILSMMESKGIPATTHIIRNYVELLCLGGEIETATSIVEDYLTSEDLETRQMVNNITIYRVATENAAAGNFETAKKLASMMTEYVAALHRGIKSREQRHEHLAKIENLKNNVRGEE